MRQSRNPHRNAWLERHHQFRKRMHELMPKWKAEANAFFEKLMREGDTPDMILCGEEYANGFAKLLEPRPRWRRYGYQIPIEVTRFG